MSIRVPIHLPCDKPWAAGGSPAYFEVVLECKDFDRDSIEQSANARYWIHAAYNDLERAFNILQMYERTLMRTSAKMKDPRLVWIRNRMQEIYGTMNDLRQEWGV
jgi:hypothetical protein